MGTTIIPVSPPQEIQLTDFRGAWTRPDPASLPPNQALLSLNAEYNPNQFSSRNGFGPLVNTNKIVSTLFNWIKAADAVSPTGNYLLLYNKTDNKVQFIVNMASPFLTDLFTVNCEMIDAASSGNQLFLASVNASAPLTPTGAAQCRIVGIYGAAINVDKAFLGPLTTKPTLSNTGTGSVTAGPHFVGYIITTRNGYTGPICPATATYPYLPDQTSTITAPGGKQITVAITATWPAEAMNITLVMTATTNPFQFFTIPGAVYGVPGGALFTVNAVIDISDTQLINNTTDITNNQYFLTQDPTGNGPFSPFKVIIYGGRTVYLTYDQNPVAAAYISNLDNPQQLTEQFHKKLLPGFLKMTSGFVLRQALYILGPNWTYLFQDNGQLPVAWPPAALVDGQIGTPSVEGVTVTASGDWAAVAHTTGLYIFDGVYQDKPISYMVDSDWRRINWGAAQTLRLADNHDKKILLVAVPLDGAASPNYLMKFDYSDGLDFESVKYSLWNLANYNPRALCIYQNNTTARLEFLLGPSVAGKILRQMNTTDDTNPWTDDGAAIALTQQLAPVSGGEIGQVYAFTQAYVRARGLGLLQGAAASLDGTIQVQWSKPINLSTNPGVEYFRQFYLRDEACSLTFTCGTNAGDYAIIAAVRQLFYPYASRR